MKSLIYLFLTLIVLNGCSINHKYADVYDNHLQKFAKHNSFKTHKIKRGKYTLIAREFGEENKDKKPTILLMHGFPDSQHLYDEVIPYLSKHRHIISFDYLGWGDSDKPYKHVYNTKSLIADIDSIVKYFNLKNIVIVTHDASGPAGIDWSIEHSKRVHALVLLNTYYYPMKTLIPPEAIKLFSTPSLKRSFTIFLANHSDRVWLSGMIEQLDKFMINTSKKDEYSKIFAYQALGIRPAFFGLNSVLIKETQNRVPYAKKRLGNFKKPVLVLFGAKDPYLNVGVAKEFHLLFPNSKLHLIKDGAHYVQIDSPKEVAKYILEESR